jgi:MoaA/NifB/PqqE/SkfB family radical SAM enzyme
MANIGYIQVTRKCNQKCRFCSNPPNDNYFSLSQLFKFIDKFKKEGYEGIILTGGEPTLYSDLDKVINYCIQKNIPVRIITNAQKLKEFDYAKHLKDSGLKDLHISLYSCRRKIQNFLTENPFSFDNLSKALYNVGKLGFKVNINIVINKYNADHLSSVVKWVVENFPFVSHFVFNNLDPLMNRAMQHPDTIPQLIDFEMELDEAMHFLYSQNKTFRVERVPLCYMANFPHFSTETRKIVKKEERIVHFLDNKRTIRQKNWFYEKTDCCKICRVNSICAGLYQGNRFYRFSQLYPLFIDPKQVIKKIKSEKET